MKEFIRIILLCIVAAIVYGLIHDQITARVCLEYFTIGHPRMFTSDSPTLHALYWGIAATWWAGLIIGLLLATASRASPLPKLTWREQVWPVVILLVVMGICAAVIGVSVYHNAMADGGAGYAETFGVDPRLPPAAWPGFYADAMTHLTSYGVGFLGGFVLCVVTLIRRLLRRRPTHEALPGSVIA